MNVFLYRIQCLTNMHVGGGDFSYDVVDNQVEKDPVLETPVIHSTGVKGALRSHFQQLLGKNEIARIFGSPVKNSQGNQEESSPGSYCFLDAGMLARPLRVSLADGKRGGPSFVLATSFEIIKTTAKLLIGLGVPSLGGADNKKIADFSEIPNTSMFFKLNEDMGIKEVEGIPVRQEPLSDPDFYKFTKFLLDTDHAVIIRNSVFRDIPLPILAHNQLEEGISKNLFYEEVVPHQSLFLLPILTPGEKNELDFGFQKYMVQFGSGASLGYGLTSLKEVELRNDDKQV